MFGGREGGGISSTVPPNKHNLSPYGNQSTYQHLSDARFLPAVQDCGSMNRNNLPCQFSIYQMTGANTDFPTINTVNISDSVINLLTHSLFLKAPSS